MILPDVNVLIYAFRTEADHHAAYASWLQGLIDGDDDLALLDQSLLGLVRIVTDRRIMQTPAPASKALDFVERLITAPRSRWLPGGAPAWAELRRLVATDRLITGPRVPDAHLAAVAIAHGCRVATADRGFARYPGLDWFDPIAA